MQSNSNRFLLTCGVITLVACICLSLVSISGAGLFLFNRSSSPATGSVVATEVATIAISTEATTQSISPTLAPTSEPSLASTAEATPEATLPPAGEIPADVAQQMDQIQDQVVELRDLPAADNVGRKLITPKQLRQKVVDDFLKDYTKEDAQNDVRVLSAFGLLEPGFDLYNFYTDLLSEQIAGFYDDKTKEMYVIQGEGFQGPERLTYAHEYTHALQDHAYDIENGLRYNNDICKTESERCAAVQALLEGDASLLEIEWLSNFATAQDRVEIQQFYNNYQSPVYDSAPDFLKEDFVFPYTKGQDFVDHLHSAGGWSTVNNAYGNPPLSTEQILHPERYPDDKPIDVPVPDLASTLGEGWKEIDRNEMGEWYTYLILAHGLDINARVDDSQAQEASTGWGGDTYVVYTQNQGDGTVALLKSEWDTQGDALEFSTAFQDYAKARFGDPILNESNQVAWEHDGGYDLFQFEGSQTIWISAPDADTANAVLQAISNQ
jgi:hypothetical protein